MTFGSFTKDLARLKHEQRTPLPIPIGRSLRATASRVKADWPLLGLVQVRKANSIPFGQVDRVPAGCHGCALVQEFECRLVLARTLVMVSFMSSDKDSDPGGNLAEPIVRKTDSRLSSCRPLCVLGAGLA